MIREQSHRHTFPRCLLDNPHCPVVEILLLQRQVQHQQHPAPYVNQAFENISEQALKHAAPPKQTGGPTIPFVRIGDAIRILLDAKRQSNLRERYLLSLDHYLHLFARGREDRPLAEFTSEMILDWFSSRQEKPSTRRSNLGRLSSLFGFAMRQGWISHNPCDRIEKVRVERECPQILSIRQCLRALTWTRQNRPWMLGWLSLALLAGLRPCEAKAISWDAIDLNNDTIRVDARITKTRRTRIVKMTPATKYWLRLAQQFDAWLPCKDTTHCRFRKLLRKALRLHNLPQDCLRHTAASYLLGHYQDASYVATQLGNSTAILHAHYKSLVTPADAEKFVNATPHATARSTRYVVEFFGKHKDCPMRAHLTGRLGGQLAQG